MTTPRRMMLERGAQSNWAKNIWLANQIIDGASREVYEARVVNTNRPQEVRQSLHMLG
jgi:hypothetical protein